MTGRSICGPIRSEDVASAGLDLRSADSSHLTDVDLYTAMLAIRLFEERVRDLRLAGDIVGSVHLEIGQEAIPVGALLALRTADPVFATYRGHGWALASGASIAAMFGEMLGRENGVNGGRGGSAYLSDVGHGFYGENSIVGAGAPIACGAALAAQRSESGQVALTVFGDGAMNQGSVSEALNFASAMKLPVIFLCENNRYSELTLLTDVVANDRLHERGAPYHIPGVRIDGNDARAVAMAVSEAAERARHGGGPTVIEATTERIVGHYIGDHEQYRVAGELERINEDEPIARLLRVIAASEAENARAQVAELVNQASALALASDLADEDSVLAHLYADRDEHG